jgi:hypothetical protein
MAAAGIVSRKRWQRDTPHKKPASIYKTPCSSRKHPNLQNVAEKSKMGGSFLNS